MREAHTPRSSHVPRGPSSGPDCVRNNAPAPRPASTTAHATCRAGHASPRSVPWRKRWQTGQSPPDGSKSAWLEAHGGQSVQHLTDDAHAAVRGPPPFRRSDYRSLHRMRLGCQAGHGNEGAARWAACECLLPHAVRNGVPVVPSMMTELSRCENTAINPVDPSGVKSVILRSETGLKYSTFWAHGYLWISIGSVKIGLSWSRTRGTRSTLHTGQEQAAVLFSLLRPPTNSNVGIWPCDPLYRNWQCLDMEQERDLLLSTAACWHLSVPEPCQWFGDNNQS